MRVQCLLNGCFAIVLLFSEANSNGETSLQSKKVKNSRKFENILGRRYRFSRAKTHKDILLPKSGTSPSPEDKKKVLENVTLKQDSSLAENTTSEYEIRNETLAQADLADDDDGKDPQPPIRPFDEWTKEELEKQQLDREQKIIEQQQQIHAKVSGAAAGPIPPDGSVPHISKDPLKHQPGAQAELQVSGVIKGATPTGGVPAQIPTVVTHRNYASKDCGAKIMNTNSEAQNAKAVLNEKDRDEYLLNPCQMEGQKFFTVELCETIQPTRFEMANFELFSSSPKDFVLWGSERYPTNEWTQLGAWTADDQREIQGFDVTARGSYAKFIKIDLNSHYGAEHFCPLSLIRVFGISFVEEFEQEATMAAQDQQIPAQAPLDKVEIKPSEPNKTEESESSKGYPLSPTPSEEPKKKDLLVSAKDAVATIAKGVYHKAQELLGGTKAVGNGTENCKNNKTVSMAENFTFWLRLCYTCKASPTFSDLRTWRLCHYFAPTRSLMVYEHLREQINRSSGAHATNSESKSSSGGEQVMLSGRELTERNGILTLDKGDVLKGGKATEEMETTVSSEEDTDQNGVSLKGSSPPSSTKDYVLPTTSPAHSSRQRFEKLLKQLREKSRAQSKLGAEKSAQMGANVIHGQTQNFTNGGTSGADSKMPSGVLPGASYSAKESVFIKLNNRIKILELNISLSSKYLSELSRNYKKQMEDIQKQYNRTLRALNETRRKTEEGDAVQSAQIKLLREEVERMGGALKEMKLHQAYFYEEFWKYHSVLLLTEFFILLIFVRCCSGGTNRRLINDAIRDELRRRPQAQNLNGGIVPNGCVSHGSARGERSGNNTQGSSNYLPEEDVDLPGGNFNNPLLLSPTHSKRHKKKKNKHQRKRSHSSISKTSSNRTETPPLQFFIGEHPTREPVPSFSVAMTTSNERAFLNEAGLARAPSIWTERPTIENWKKQPPMRVEKATTSPIWTKVPTKHGKVTLLEHKRNISSSMTSKKSPVGEIGKTNYFRCLKTSPERKKSA